MCNFEYINALSILIKKGAYPSKNLDHMLDHLTDLTKVTKERHREGILAWSQFVFDTVESEDFWWDNWNKIQQARAAMRNTIPLVEALQTLKSCCQSVE